MAAQSPEYYYAQLKTQGYDFDGEDWTEADTRSKFIDKLLIECLNWREMDIRRELHTTEGRLDYILRISKPTLIIEAKRSRAKLYTRTQADSYRVALATLFKSDPDSAEPIKQAQGYCAAKSVPIGVVTNGKTLAAFIATRTDGIPWEEGDVLIFPDILSEQFNFSELYNFLSREALVAGSLHKRLRSKGLPAPPRDVVSEYPDPRLLIAQNPIGKALEPILKPLFAQLVNPESLDVLRHCYVIPPTSRSKDPDIESLIRHRVPHFAADAVSIDSLAAFRQFEDTLAVHSLSKDSGATILVIGAIGAGKTTFLRRFFEIELSALGPEYPAANTIPLYVNFQTPPSSPDDIGRFVYASLRHQIEALDEKPVPGVKDKTFDLLSSVGLQHLFLKDYQKFLKLEGELRSADPAAFSTMRARFLGRLRDDDEQFVRAAIGTLKERYHRRVVVIVDNVDQCNAEFQSRAYLFCQTIEEQLKCTIIVALREEWYWYHGVGREGPLSAYHNVVFHVPAPRVRDVLDKRLSYAIKTLESQKIRSQPIATRSGLQVMPEHLVHYVRSCKDAFFGADDIALFLESLANGSIRNGMERFLDFVRSGHTHEDEYLEAYVKRGEYKIQFHQTFKSIAFGLYRHYSSDRSRVGNLFKPYFFGSDHSIYFLNVYLLRWLRTRVGVSSPAGRGYVARQELVREIEYIGAPESFIEEVITNMVRKGWITPDVPLPVDDIVDGELFKSQKDVWRFFRITAWGHYSLINLSSSFAYLEAVMLDTPLFEGEFVDRLVDTYSEGKKVSVDYRRPLVAEFVTILERIEQVEREAFTRWEWAKSLEPYMALVKERFESELDRIGQIAELMRAN